MALVGLIVHVAGEHLGWWRDGVQLLNVALRGKLQSVMTPPLQAALQRGMLTLQYAENERTNLGELTPGDPAIGVRAQQL